MLDIDKEVVVSKTELKKDSKKIQAFGKKISELTVKNIETFKFSPNIYEAIIDLKNIKSNAAKKRQVQYVGKLLREIDLTPAFLIIEQLKVSSQKETQQNHSIEKWREELLINADKFIMVFLIIFFKSIFVLYELQIIGSLYINHNSNNPSSKLLNFRSTF